MAEARRAILTVDIGSTSVKALLWWRKSMRVVDWSVCESPSPLMASGSAEEMVRAVDALVDELIGRVRNRRGEVEICAVGFACFAMSLIGISLESLQSNNTWKATTPVFSYATTSGEANVNNQLPISARNGVPNPLLPCFALAHIIDKGDKVEQWTSLPSWILLAWTEADSPPPVSLSEASWWGLLDPCTLKWDHELLRRCAVPLSRLPAVSDFDQALELKLGATRTARWPELNSARLFLGLGDGAAATVGAGAQEGDLVITVGTSAAARTLHREFIAPPPGLFCYRVSRHWTVLGGSLTDGGRAVDLIQTLVGKQSVNPEPTSVVCLPYFAGERSFGWRGAQLSGCFVGVTHETTPSHLVNAACAGVCSLLRRIADAMAWKPSSESAVRVNGGALNSPLWREWLSAALSGLPLTVCGQQATSRGVAILIANVMTSPGGGEFEHFADDDAAEMVAAAPLALVKTMDQLHLRARAVMDAMPWTKL